MPHTIFITSSTDQHSTNLAARIEQLIEQADTETDDLSVRSLFGCDEAANWTAGDPCPRCGGTVFSVMEVTEHLYESVKDGPDEYHLEYATHGDAIGPTLDYRCLDCETDIRGIPLAVLDVPADGAND